MSIDKLQFIDLSFWFNPKIPVINKATFEFPMNCNLYFDSHSGAGKSVVFKILMGLLSPAAGDYLINGKSTLEMSFVDFQEYRLSMGYGFDAGGLLNNRTLKDNLKLPLLFHELCSPQEAEERAMALLEHFTIADAALNLPASVSGSKRKCAILARSLIHRPQMLLLDDPTTGLGAEQVRRLISLIEEHKNSYGLRHVFFTSQGQHFVKAMNPQTARLHDGLITLDRRKQEELAA